MHKGLSDLNPHHWPVLVAHVVSRAFDPKTQESFLNSSSYLAVRGRVGNHQEFENILSVSNSIPNLTLKEAESILEKSLAVDVRKTDGAVYTPDFVIDYIVEEVLGGLDEKALRQATILDPACGSGGFLLGALRFISSRTGESFSEISKRLKGLDINGDAIQNANLLVNLACFQNCNQESEAGIFICDSLLTPISDQLAMVGCKNGVTALVTNPPYVKLQTLPVDYRRKISSVFPSLASGSYTLATLFLARAKEYLTGDGVAGFITLNNLFTSLSGQPIRDQWHKTKEVRKVIDFRHFPVFEASAYTCLIFMDGQIRSEFQYSAINEQPTAVSLDKLRFSPVAYSNLNPKKWRLVSSSNSKIVSALESVGSKLGQEAEIKVGIATLFDKAFLCQISGDGYSVIGGDGIERFVEDLVVQRFVKISELSEVKTVEQAQRGVIYPYDTGTLSRPLLTWEEIQSRFPIAAEHLVSWKERLLERSGVDQERWYEWGRRQSMIAPGPKLLTKTFDKKPTFHLDQTDGLFANGYSIKPKVALDGYSIHALKAFLESRLMFAYALMTSFEIEGGYQCYQKNFIENVCLPPVDLLPDSPGVVIEARSRLEAALCEYYGFTCKELDACLGDYLSESSVLK